MKMTLILLAFKGLGSFTSRRFSLRRNLRCHSSGFLSPILAHCVEGRDSAHLQAAMTDPVAVAPIDVTNTPPTDAIVPEAVETEEPSTTPLKVAAPDSAESISAQKKWLGEEEDNLEEQLFEGLPETGHLRSTKHHDVAVQFPELHDPHAHDLTFLDLHLDAGGHDHDHPDGPPSFFSSLMSGLVCGLIYYVFSALFASMIFDEAGANIPQYAAIGVNMGVLSAFTGGLIFVFNSGCRSVMAGPDITPAVFMVEAAKTIYDGLCPDGISDCPVDDRAAILPTLMISIWIMTFIGGLAYLLLGHYKLTGMVGFMPANVTSGFLSCIGYKVTYYAIEVACGTKFKVRSTLLRPPPLPARRRRRRPAHPHFVSAPCAQWFKYKYLKRVFGSWDPQYFHAATGVDNALPLPPLLLCSAVPPTAPLSFSALPSPAYQCSLASSTPPSRLLLSALRPLCSSPAATSHPLLAPPRPSSVLLIRSYPLASLSLLFLPSRSDTCPYTHQAWKGGWKLIVPSLFIGVPLYIAKRQCEPIQTRATPISRVSHSHPSPSLSLLFSALLSPAPILPLLPPPLTILASRLPHSPHAPQPPRSPELQLPNHDFRAHRHFLHHSLRVGRRHGLCPHQRLALPQV